jgi:uncharacterized membrane protein
MAAGATASVNPGVAGAPVSATSGGLEPHIASCLCYIPIFPFGILAAIIFLVVAPFNQNKFVRFNAFQSLFLHIAVVVLSFALFFVALIVTALIHFLAFIFIPVWPILWIGILVLFLYMMYKSFNNEKIKLPFIGDLAEKQA